MQKYLFLIHRYLGIGLSLIMLLWCLSGFIMMYKSYPELNYQQQLQTLSPLELDDCCNLLSSSDLSNSNYQLFQIMMLKGEPVMHLYSATGLLSTVQLKNAEVFYGLDGEEAIVVAEI